MKLLGGNNMNKEVQTSGNLKYYVDKIKDRIEKVSNDFFCIGYYLWEINHFKYYLENGYENIYEFSEKELNFKKSSTNNFILLVENFADWDSNYPKMWIHEKYKAFGYSQLTEMLSLAPTKRELINPNMTIKQIREVKKVEKANDLEILEGQINILDAHFEEVAPVEVIVDASLKNEHIALNIEFDKIRIENKLLKKQLDNKYESIMDFLNGRKKILLSIIDNKSKSHDQIEYRGALHEILELIDYIEK